MRWLTSCSSRPFPLGRPRPLHGPAQRLGQPGNQATDPDKEAERDSGMSVEGDAACWFDKEVEDQPGAQERGVQAGAGIEQQGRQENGRDKEQERGRGEKVAQHQAHGADQQDQERRQTIADRKGPPAGCRGPEKECFHHVPLMAACQDAILPAHDAARP